MDPSQLVDKKQEWRRFGSSTFSLWKLSDLRAKVLILISWFILKFLYL
jgi:hypothetical protein